MSRYVLDTDVLSLYHRGEPRVVAKVNQQAAGDVAVTVITVQEQLTGWYTLLRRAKKPREMASAYQRLTDTTRFLSRQDILTFTEPAILRYEHLRTLKLNVGTMDLRIAAIVLEHGAILVTRNIRDFQRVPGLTIEDWTQ